jgi:hypothetical protein
MNQEYLVNALRTVFIVDSPIRAYDTLYRFPNGIFSLKNKDELRTDFKLGNRDKEATNENFLALQRLMKWVWENRQQPDIQKFERSFLEFFKEFMTKPGHNNIFEQLEYRLLMKSTSLKQLLNYLDILEGDDIIGQELSAQQKNSIQNTWRKFCHRHDYTLPAYQSSITTNLKKIWDLTSLQLLVGLYGLSTFLFYVTTSFFPADARDYEIFSMTVSILHGCFFKQIAQDSRFNLFILLCFYGIISVMFNGFFMEVNFVELPLAPEYRSNLNSVKYFLSFLIQPISVRNVFMYVLGEVFAMMPINVSNFALVGLLQSLVFAVDLKNRLSKEFNELPEIGQMVMVGLVLKIISPVLVRSTLNLLWKLFKKMAKIPDEIGEDDDTIPREFSRAVFVGFSVTMIYGLFHVKPDPRQYISNNLQVYDSITSHLKYPNYTRYEENDVFLHTCADWIPITAQRSLRSPPYPVPEYIPPQIWEQLLDEMNVPRNFKSFAMKLNELSPICKNIIDDNLKDPKLIENFNKILDELILLWKSNVKPGFFSSTYGLLETGGGKRSWNFVPFFRFCKRNLLRFFSIEAVFDAVVRFREGRIPIYSDVRTRPYISDAGDADDLDVFVQKIQLYALNNIRNEPMNLRDWELTDFGSLVTRYNSVRRTRFRTTHANATSDFMRTQLGYSLLINPKFLPSKIIYRKFFISAINNTYLEQYTKYIGFDDRINDTPEIKKKLREILEGESNVAWTAITRASKLFFDTVKNDVIKENVAPASSWLSWFIPESVFNYATFCLIISVGLYLDKKLEKLCGYLFLKVSNRLFPKRRRRINNQWKIMKSLSTVFEFSTDKSNEQMDNQMRNWALFMGADLFFFRQMLDFIIDAQLGQLMDIGVTWVKIFWIYASVLFYQAEMNRTDKEREVAYGKIRYVTTTPDQNAINDNTTVTLTGQESKQSKDTRIKNFQRSGLEDLRGLIRKVEILNKI